MVTVAVLNPRFTSSPRGKERPEKNRIQEVALELCCGCCSAEGLWTEFLTGVRPAVTCYLLHRAAWDLLV